MSSRSQAILSQIQALPPEERREICDHLRVLFPEAEPATRNADPILSARGIFAGGGLNSALIKHRQEERSRG